jgi:hypothetical protein
MAGPVGPLATQSIALNAVSLLSGAAAPSAGGGVAAPIGSLYLQTTGAAWIKTGSAATAWTLIETMTSLPGNPHSFEYTVTGSEPDLANIVITFGTARSDATYDVYPQLQAGTDFYGMPQITTKLDASFVLALSANAVAGDVWAFYVVDAF